MKEMLAHLELLRVQMAECERLQQAASSQLKRDVYARALTRYNAIARELERAIACLPDFRPLRRPQW
ncbi:hypothetical protein JQ581_14685 [Bradyrhizobium liaoningense]|nr:hypothetical protein [Bradyrhizobium liaoningense]MBR0738177.1 hypothetical protein [Bradyrhizobium liaoningense]